MTRKCKKIPVPAKAISRIIGRAGCNINAIREASGAHIDLDKLKNSADGIITIRGSVEATRAASDLLDALIRETDKDVEQILPVVKATRPALPPTAVPTLLVPTPCVPPTINVWKNSMAVKMAAVGAAATAAPVMAVADVVLTAGPRPLMEAVAPPARQKTETGVFTSVAPGVAAGGGTGGEEGGVGRPQPIKSFPIGAWTPVSAGPHGVAPGGRQRGAGTTQGSRTVATNQKEAIIVTTEVSSASTSGLRVAVTAATVATVANHRSSASSLTAVTAATRASSSGSVGGGGSTGSQGQFVKFDHAPLPIVTTTSAFSAKLSFTTATAPAPGGDGSQQGAGERYTPFNNLFSPIAESVMQKRAGWGAWGRRRWA